MQLNGIFDGITDWFDGGIDVGDWFGTGGSVVPGFGTGTGISAPAPPLNNLQFLTTAVVTYLRERDLNKLNRDLIEQGRTPISQAQADFMAQQYRANGSVALPGQTSVMTWLPWIALAGVAVYLVKK